MFVGQFGFFEAGLYEVLIQSQCVTYRGWRSARLKFGEAAGVAVWEVNSELLCVGTTVKHILAT